MARTRATIVTGTVVALMLTGAGVAAAGGGGGGGPCDGFAYGDTLTIEDFCFDGIAHFSDVGMELLVRNEGGTTHTFTAADGSFDSGEIAPGDSFTVPLDEPGIIRVYCRPHGTAEGGGMAGVVIVGEPTPEGADVNALAGDLRKTLRSELASMREAIEKQASSMRGFPGKMAVLSHDVRQLRAAAEEEASAEPTVLGVTSGPQSGNAGLAVLVGLALGVAGSALVVGRRVLNRRPQATSGD